MKKLLLGAAVLALAVMTSMGMSLADEEKTAKNTIKQVMKRCLKGGLCKKVAGGEGSAEEKAELLFMFESLANNEPPKGDADSWKEKTMALVEAAKEVVNGKDSGPGKLKKAANCGACHKAHKGKKS